MSNRTISEIITDKAKQIKMLIMDVDGVLTDGKIIIDTHGNELKIFNVYDGAGIDMAHKAGLLTAIISGRYCNAVVYRAKELHINEVYQSVGDKIDVFHSLLDKYMLVTSQVAYIGDDIFDIPLLEQVGLSIAPCNAIPEVKDIVDYVTKNSGGNGAVREMVDMILKAQDKYPLMKNR
jgi:3-deoxy-D-manno-octulosonate 8-phosphate phosphatase (KDO 8-P phosphatase)